MDQACELKGEEKVALPSAFRENQVQQVQRHNLGCSDYCIFFSFCIPEQKKGSGVVDYPITILAALNRQLSKVVLTQGYYATDEANSTDWPKTFERRKF